MSQSTTSTLSASASMPQASTSPTLPANSLNVFAQKLNNSAALCIEVGQYDRAILSLQRALRLCEKHTHQMKESSLQANKVSEFTLDGCIAFSEANSLFSKSKGKRPNSTTVREVTEASASTNTVRRENGNKRRRIDIAAKESECDSEDVLSAPPNFDINSEESNTKYYVYHRPIRVPRQGQEMGSVLFLIVLFNLALAHHLKVTDMSAVRDPSPSHAKGMAKAIKKSLMLYQLVVKYWSNLQRRMEENTVSLSPGSKSNNYSSIWFRMILHNNLGQIYNWTEKPSKERECLQDLLSTVLLATDQTNQHGRGSLPKGFQRDMEGFLANTAALTIHERCAEAA